MSGQYPRAPAFRAINLKSSQPVLESRTQSGRRQVRLVGGHVWSFTAKYALMTRSQFMPIFAFSMRQKGSYESFSVIPPDLAVPQGTITAGGAMVLDGRETGAWLADVTDGTTDQSVNANTLTENGTVTMSAAGTGTAMQAFSGFSAANYFSRAYDADFDYGTGDFFYSVWFKSSSTGSFETLLQRTDAAATGGGRIDINIKPTTSYLRVLMSDDNGVSGDVVDTTYAVDDGLWRGMTMVVSSSVLYLYINGLLVGSTSVIAASSGVNNATAILTIGGGADLSLPGTSTTMAMAKTGAYAPTEAEIRRTYDIEKRLFETSALYGIIPKVNGASQTGNTLVADGYPVSTLVHKAGDIISPGTKRKVYMATEDATTDSTGAVSIEIEPALESSPQDNASITYYNVPFNMAFNGNVQEYNGQVPTLYSFEVDLQEVF